MQKIIRVVDQFLTFTFLVEILSALWIYNVESVAGKDTLNINTCVFILWFSALGFLLVRRRDQKRQDADD